MEGTRYDTVLVIGTIGTIASLHTLLIHSMVEVWQLLLASAGAVLALGGLLLGVAHAVMLLRARRRAVRQARYAELQDLSPPHSDREAEPSGGGRRGPPLTLETRPASRTSSSGGSADALL